MTASRWGFRDKRGRFARSERVAQRRGKRGTRYYDLATGARIDRKRASELATEERAVLANPLLALVEAALRHPTSGAYAELEAATVVRTFYPTEFEFIDIFSPMDRHAAWIGRHEPGSWLLAPWGALDVIYPDGEQYEIRFVGKKSFAFQPPEFRPGPGQRLEDVITKIEGVVMGRGGTLAIREIGWLIVPRAMDDERKTWRNAR